MFKPITLAKIINCENKLTGLAKNCLLDFVNLYASGNSFSSSIPCGNLGNVFDLFLKKTLSIDLRLYLILLFQVF